MSGLRDRSSSPSQALIDFCRLRVTSRARVPSVMALVTHPIRARHCIPPHAWCHRLGAIAFALTTAACGGGALNATAAPGAPSAPGHALVVGRLSSLGCPDQRSLMNMALGAGDTGSVLLSKDGQQYAVEPATRSGFFVADLPPGRYAVANLRIPELKADQYRDMLLLPKGWSFEVRPGPPTYVGSIRVLCLGWESTGTATETHVVVGVVREYEAARADFQVAFPSAGMPVDGSEPLSKLAVLPRESGFDYELTARIGGADESAPPALWTMVRGLVKAPLPPGVERTGKPSEYRLRYGEWEVLYLFDEGARWIIVTTVRKAGSGSIGGRSGR